MQITTTEADGTSVVRINGDLRIGSVADAKAEFVAALATSSRLRLDLSNLGECDTAGIQLLLMACASARAKGATFQTIGLPASLRAALDRVGIAAECLEIQTGSPGSGQDGG